MPTPDQLWAELNHSLVTRKIRVPSVRMHAEIEKTRKRVYYEYGPMGKNNSAGLFPALIDAELEISKEYIEAVYDIHLEVWKLQGKALSHMFIRAVLERQIVSIIDARKGAIGSHLGQLAGATRTYANLSAIQHSLIQKTNQLLSLWVNRCGIEGDTLTTRLGLEMNELCAGSDVEQRNARIARRSWELYQPAPEGTAPRNGAKDFTGSAGSGRFLPMQTEKQWVLALARFEAFRKHLPASIDQKRVDEYHSLLDALEAASKDDLSGFRIPPSEMEPDIAGASPPPFRGRGRGSLYYSGVLSCDEGFFKRQVDGLWNYVSKLSPRTDAPPAPAEGIDRNTPLGHGQFPAPPVGDPIRERDGAQLKSQVEDAAITPVPDAEGPVRVPCINEIRARTVAKVIKELDGLRGAIYGEEDYQSMRVRYPEHLTFQVAEGAPTLKKKLIHLNEHRSHILLAQEIAAAHHSKSVETIKTDWKKFKPADRRRK